MKRFSNIAVLFLLGCLLIGCAFEGTWDPMSGSAYNHAERLIVNGCVTNTEAEPLPGIRVDLYGVREANEPDLASYNYAITDSAGRYAIIRYLGREKPTEVTVEATDPQGVYKPQAIVAQKTAIESIDSFSGVEIAIEIYVNFTLDK